MSKITSIYKYQSSLFIDLIENRGYRIDFMSATIILKCIIS